MYEQRFGPRGPDAYTGVGHVVALLWLAVFVASIGLVVAPRMVHIDNNPTVAGGLLTVLTCIALFVAALAFSSWFPKAF